MQHQAPQEIVIIGGGTAGWMAANLLAHQWRSHGTQIMLIESSDIGIIGVGEGSTPYLRQFFHRLGIQESEWMPACNATYKCGIRFPGWSTQPGYEQYVHPFFNQEDLKVGSELFTNARLRRRGTAAQANPQDFFIAAELARQRKAPFYLPRSDDRPAPATDYAYHFDSGLLGAFLKGHASKLGVRHRLDTVARVELSETGDIAHLLMHSGAIVKAELFLDCSGFKGLLINEALGEPFVSFKDNLFNDRAIAIPSSLNEEEDIPSETTSTALRNGWVWQIPLSSRYGNGYVYASDFASPEKAETELRQHLGAAAHNKEARHLKMRVGRVEQHWRNNCLAIGLSQGFIEPLEATALMLIQFSVDLFIDQMEASQFSRSRQAQFNRRINQMFEGVRDYVVGHYQLNTRHDSDYWRANRAHRHISDRLASILEVWDQGGDFEAELTRHGEALMYIRPSWYCLLAGMGRFPADLKPLSTEQRAELMSGEQARAALTDTVTQFYGHRQYLQLLK
ncbi:tryptophan halogenase family protein [Roseateles albus]|uniref:Tryptophan 7-halogenase n=1 Tax=Roseateles albus TaxID=2987525 RepID=A0ABT5KIT2_9BURK|nr:tryptophan halogenase family protein [Roseateles albus]MDC8773840.1 tryptophan 7-halogenase [Roseateles albus]